MPVKDIYHDTVKNALIKDGWTITHDPLIRDVILRRSCDGTRFVRFLQYA